MTRRRPRESSYRRPGRASVYAKNCLISTATAQSVFFLFATLWKNGRDENRMTKREKFLNYVRHGGDVPMVSIQIGAGAGFDTKLAGKQWVSETTIDDTLSAIEQVGGDVLVNLGLPGFDAHVPHLAWKSETSHAGQDRVTRSHLDTPYGVLEWEYHERIKQGTTPVKYPLKFGDSLDAVLWMLEKQYEGVRYIPEMVGPVLAQVQPKYAVCIQWSVQPFELLCLTPAPDAVMFAMSDTEGYRNLCDRILEVNLALCSAVIGSGADFVFVGGPGRELMSPFLYETFIVPDSKKISETVHEAGGLVYSHICSPVQPFLDMGYYGQMGLDLFETLSPPPVGNVSSLKKARENLPEQMCTRGNIGLDVLLEGTPEDAERETLRVLEETKGSKHIVAASDYLFYDIPLENVQAVVKTVEAAA